MQEGGGGAGRAKRGRYATGDGKGLARRVIHATADRKGHGRGGMISTDEGRKVMGGLKVAEEGKGQTRKGKQ